MLSDAPPNRLCNDPRGPYFNAEAPARDVGIRFKGVEKTNVEKYCVSEEWIRVAAGNAKDRFGNPLTIKLTGKVEAYFKNKRA
jgi:predicted house-cleaning NTP pyrophosphatase (Maf/HAM1 superfamily)